MKPFINFSSHIFRFVITLAYFPFLMGNCEMILLNLKLWFVFCHSQCRFFAHISSVKQFRLLGSTILFLVRILRTSFWINFNQHPLVLPYWCLINPKIAFLILMWIVYLALKVFRQFLSFNSVHYFLKVTLRCF